MNKYVLMLVAAGLIATAPAYYAFQAQAEEAVPSTEASTPAAPTAADESAADEVVTPEAKEAAASESAAGNKPATPAQGTNE